MHSSVEYISFSHIRDRTKINNYRCTLCGAEFKANKSMRNNTGLSRVCDCVKLENRRKKAEAALEPIGSTFVHSIGQKITGGKNQFVFLFQCDDCGAEFEAYGRRGVKWPNNLSKKCKCSLKRRDNESSLVSQEWASLGQAPRINKLKKIAPVTRQDNRCARRKDPYSHLATCLNCVKFETGKCPVNPCELVRIDTRKYSCDQFSF